MLNWTFLNPWFLVGLAGAALPVIVHLLTRPRPRPIAFPPFRLLHEAGSSRQRVHRLRTIVILSLRALAVAALAIVFARPFLQESLAQGPRDGVRRVVLVVDASASMQGVKQGISRFAQARAEAAAVLDSLPPGSQAAVVTVGATPRSVLPGLSRNRQVLRDALRQTEPNWERGDPAKALDLAGDLLEGGGEIYVFSDMQRSNWGRVRLARDERTKLYLRPVEPVEENLGITGLRLSPAHPVVGETVLADCTVFNSSAVRRRATVRLSVGGIERTASVELRPYASATTTLTFAPPSAGSFAGQVSLDGDALSADDRRYFSLAVRRELNVLIVSDAPARERDGAAHLLAMALAPSPESAPGVRLIRRSGQGTEREAIDAADVIVLAPPLALPGQTCKGIARRVLQGAHLLALIDGATAPAWLNALMAVSEDRLAPPFRLRGEQAVFSGDGMRLALLRRGDDGDLMQEEAIRRDLEEARFKRHYATINDKTRVEEVLATFADGSVAIAVSPAGRGAAAYLNLPVVPAATNLPRSGAFPVLVSGLLQRMRQRERVGDVSPGQTLEMAVPLDIVSADAAVRLQGPAGEQVEYAVLARGRELRLATPQVSRPGHFIARHETSTLAVATANLSEAETDLRPLPLEQLATGSRNVAVVNDAGELRSVGREREWWPWLLALCVACLAAEMLLLAVWRPERRGRP